MKLARRYEQACELLLQMEDIEDRLNPQLVRLGEQVHDLVLHPGNRKWVQGLDHDVVLWLVSDIRHPVRAGIDYHKNVRYLRQLLDTALRDLYQKEAEAKRRDEYSLSKKPLLVRGWIRGWRWVRAHPWFWVPAALALASWTVQAYLFS